MVASCSQPAQTGFLTLLFTFFCFPCGSLWIPVECHSFQKRRPSSISRSEFCLEQLHRTPRSYLHRSGAFTDRHNSMHIHCQHCADRCGICSCVPNPWRPLPDLEPDTWRFEVNNWLPVSWHMMLQLSSTGLQPFQWSFSYRFFGPRVLPSGAWSFNLFGLLGFGP